MSKLFEQEDNNALNGSGENKPTADNTTDHDSADMNTMDSEYHAESSSAPYGEDENTESEAGTASTVYTPSPSSAFVYSDEPKAEDRSEKNVSRGRVAMTAILLSLCLILGVVGGAGGTMFALMRHSETGNADGGETSDGASVQGTNTATLYKQTATVSVVELPETGTELTVAQVNAKVADSVVAIGTSVQMTSNFYGGFYVTTGAGSGVIISSEGYIVTNYHVIEDASEIEVTLNNGNVYTAVCLDGDKVLDIALLKIEPEELLTPVEIGSSTALAVGQEVVAVGNPLGTLPGTVTDGIVSALDRTVEIEGYSRTLIQTDAAINPGNSGGGLFDRYGRLVGIVNAKESSEGVEGLGFAIPIDAVFDEIVEIIEDGYIHGRAALDLEMREISDVKEAYALYRNQTVGIYIQSSGYGAGLDIREGDRLLALNGIEISSRSDLDSVLASLSPGDTVTLRLGRVQVVSSGFWSSYTEKPVEVTVTLEEYIPSYAITFE